MDRPMQEERTFAPVGARVVKTRPVRIKGATTAECARGINDLHGCLNDARSKVMLLMLALGLPEDATEEDARRIRPKVNSHLSASQIFKIAGAVCGSIGGLFLIVRVLAAAFPPIWHAILTVN